MNQWFDDFSFILGDNVIDVEEFSYVLSEFECSEKTAKQAFLIFTQVSDKRKWGWLWAVVDGGTLPGWQAGGIEKGEIIFPNWEIRIRGATGKQHCKNIFICNSPSHLTLSTIE